MVAIELVLERRLFPLLTCAKAGEVKPTIVVDILFDISPIFIFPHLTAFHVCCVSLRKSAVVRNACEVGRNRANAVAHTAKTNLTCQKDNIFIRNVQISHA